MIYTVANFEKMHTQLYKNGSQIIGQRFVFMDSQGPMLIGGFLIFFTGVQILIAYLNNKLIITGFKPENIIPLLLICLGGWLFLKGRTSWNERKEQGGVMPSDTFIVLDGTTQTVIKQKGTEEQTLGKMKDIRLEIERRRKKNSTQYHLIVIHPAGKEILTIFSNKLQAEKLLNEVKTILKIA